MNPADELVAMLTEDVTSEDGCTIFNHTPEEIGLHVMENHAAFVTALRTQSPMPAASAEPVAWGYALKYKKCGWGMRVVNEGDWLHKLEEEAANLRTSPTSQMSKSSPSTPRHPCKRPCRRLMVPI